MNLTDPGEESAMLHAVLETVVDAVVTIDESGIIRNVNPAVLHLFGYTREDLIGNNVSVLMPSPDRERHDEYIANFLRTGIAKIIGIGREVTALKKNGERIPIDLSVTEVVFDHTRLFTGIIRDMSERNRNRVALDRERIFADSLVETAHAIVVLLEPSGKIRRINPFLEELTGYTQEEVQGQDWFETFIHPEEEPELRKLFEQTLLGIPVHSHVNTICTKSGERRLITWSGKTLADSHEKPLGILAIGNDITELYQAQQKLIQSERLAAIGQMVTGLAHESRNALQRANASLEVLSLDLEDQPQLNSLVERVQRALEELQYLYEEVRNYAAPLKLRYQPTDISKVAETTWHHLLDQWRPKNIQLTIGKQESIPIVFGDTLRIQQVLRNILENAIFVAPEDSEVTVRTQMTSLDGRSAIRLWVSDQGSGMTEAQRDSIFNPFYTTKTKGTGLGMAISKRIIEAHHGTICVEDNSPAGVTIEIVLPCKQVTAP